MTVDQLIAALQRLADESPCLPIELAELARSDKETAEDRMTTSTR